MLLKRRLSALFATALLSASLSAGGSAAFELKLPTDLAVGLSGASAFTLGQVLPAPETGTAFGWWDEALVANYQPTLDTVSDLTSLAALAAFPLLLDTWDVPNLTTLGVLYAEAGLLAVGLKDLLKATVKRPRPWATLAPYPNDLEAEKAFVSFPSGHTTVAFVSAGLATAVIWRGEDPEALKWAVTAGSFSLATATAVLRVAAGQHYWSDVLAGAALGSAVGFAVPWLHTAR